MGESGAVDEGSFTRAKASAMRGSSRDHPVVPETTRAPAFASASRFATAADGRVNSNTTSAERPRSVVIPAASAFSEEASVQTTSCPLAAATVSISRPILPLPMMPKRIRRSYQ
jgi:hypothetical protein